MVSFELSKEREKDVVRHVTSVGQRKMTLSIDIADLNGGAVGRVSTIKSDEVLTPLITEPEMKIVSYLS